MIRRAALGLLWVAALAAGVALDQFGMVRPELYIHLSQAFAQAGVTSAYDLARYIANALEGIAASLPSAVLLAVLVKGSRDRLVIGLGWLAIPIVMAAFAIPLGALLEPLRPKLSPFGGVPPSSAFLPMLLLNAAIYYSILGGLQALLLRRHLTLPIGWVALKALGAISSVLLGEWLISIEQTAWLSALSELVYFAFGVAGMALLWRWDVAPSAPLKWKLPLPRRPVDPTATSAYGTWIADLENSLDKPKPT